MSTQKMHKTNVLFSVCNSIKNKHKNGRKSITLDNVQDNNYSPIIFNFQNNSYCCVFLPLS